MMFPLLTSILRNGVVEKASVLPITHLTLLFPKRQGFLLGEDAGCLPSPRLCSAPFCALFNKGLNTIK